MTEMFDPERDLTIERFIRAPRAAVWDAWTLPRQFEQWWVPEPAKCRAVRFEAVPGGPLVTEISEAGQPFAPHMNACFLIVEPQRRLIFTDALLAGFRPAPNSFITAEITLDEMNGGTQYAARVMHSDRATRDKHAELGFYDGWGTVIEQLARFVEVPTS
ncbi:SRPBCC domain-containing protein [Devosia sp. Root105]|uniref:SRPBCC domain-containing protein n=1 Tax=Devosia sp. Root105 TaxID=1736423 RepID=UPI0006FA54F5|nr:SRPBCC domain-containing protein [Devosia sp. Root105]KQU97447.1 polyketide cyclase [Devosia sp. Root105]